MTRHRRPYEPLRKVLFLDSRQDGSRVVVIHRRCTLLLGVATAHLLAVYLLGLDVEFEVTGLPELIDALDAIALRARHGLPTVETRVTGSPERS